MDCRGTGVRFPPAPLNLHHHNAATDARNAAVRMAWTDLLFLHWSVPAEQMRAHIPPALELDTFDGRAWIGLVPFKMTDCRFRGFGWAPGLRDFYECNVRTYVRVGDRAGVWFFSLDAANLLPVIGGRWMWRLNYVHSRFRVEHAGDRHEYALTRRRGPWAKGSTHIVWRTGDARPLAQPGTLEHFLTERYWLFTLKRGRVFAGRIHHEPWPLRDATLESIDDGLLACAGFEGVSTRPPESVLASQRIDVIGQPLTPVDQAPPAVG
ncbi:MAG: DUF2071 domain-containing protein [Phycisphaerales bacterium]